MYYVDSPTRRIDVFDFDLATGAVANRRALVHIAREHGFPDGLILDADGYIWVALWAGSALHRYAPDGALDRVVALPASHPTKCAFGGAALDELYITSATIGLRRAGKRRAGARRRPVAHSTGRARIRAVRVWVMVAEDERRNIRVTSGVRS